MKKILYLLLTTEKYKTRQENILKSWGDNVDLYFYSEHEDLEFKVIKVCDENDVEIKQTAIFKIIGEKFINDYEWFFFGDDDTFVNTKLMELELDKLEKNMIHGLDIFGCWNSLHYPSGGAGFLIHNNLIPKFYDAKKYNVRYGDVTFGLNMLDKNISIKNNDKFMSQHPTFYNLNLDDTYKYLTFHYVNSIDDLMYMTKLCYDKIN